MNYIYLIEIIRWIGFIGFGSIMLWAIIFNYYVLFLYWKGKKIQKQQHHPSPTLFAGFLMGLVIFTLSPSESLRAYFWIPIILDPHSFFLLLTVFIDFLQQKFRSKNTDS